MALTQLARIKVIAICSWNESMSITMKPQASSSRRDEF